MPKPLRVFVTRVWGVSADTMGLGLKLAFGFILLVMIYLAIKLAWEEYFSLYWHTDIVLLYQDNESFRVCGKSKSHLPIWYPNENYNRYSPKMDAAVLSGFPITIEARVFFTEDDKEVHVVNIKGFSKGENILCKI